jgi:branched-chain amino acid transport system substrate-binding protein
MNQPRRALHMSRRDFLKAFGAAAATFIGADLSPVIGKNVHVRAGVGRPSQAVQVLKIGILLPISRIYPLLGENLLAGLSLYFDLHQKKNRNYQVQLIPEKIGMAHGSTYQKACRLVRDAQVHLVVGVISSETAAQLRNLFYENRIPLIVSNAGANAVSTSDHNPYVFYNSLSYWHANWAAGAWAAQELGKKAVVATSFYDSGYDALNAFRLGFEAAGGEIARVAVTHGPGQDKELSSLPDLIRQARPDFMYALYGGKMAEDFCQAFSESGLNRSIPLACSGFMVEDSILPQLGTEVLDVKSVFSWARGLDNAANKRFVGSYEKRTGRLADPFALLTFGARSTD